MEVEEYRERSRHACKRWSEGKNRPRHREINLSQWLARHRGMREREKGRKHRRGTRFNGPFRSIAVIGLWWKRSGSPPFVRDYSWTLSAALSTRRHKSFPLPFETALPEGCATFLPYASLIVSIPYTEINVAPRDIDDEGLEDVESDTKRIYYFLFSFFFFTCIIIVIRICHCYNWYYSRIVIFNLLIEYRRSLIKYHYLFIAEKRFFSKESFQKTLFCCRIYNFISTNKTVRYNSSLLNDLSCSLAQCNILLYWICNLLHRINSAHFRF